MKLARTQCLLALILHIVFGQDLSITFTGELALHLPTWTPVSARAELLTTKVVSKVSAHINIDERCVHMKSLEHRAMYGNASSQMVNYTVTIKEDDCITDVNLLTIGGVQELGITAFMLRPDVSVESEFWQDKMNSILVFGGCAAVLVIMLVTCLIMITGCHKRDNKNKKRSYEPSKPHLYHPYAIDTMTLDHRKYSRKENFQSIKDGTQHEPTTIERWVNSQLSKGRRQSSAIELNQDGQQCSDMKKSDSHQDMSTTDSGIVTTATRGTEGQLDYATEPQQPLDIVTQDLYGRRISEEPFYHEPHHEMCNSIDYIQHSNEAYANSVHNKDFADLEESSKL